MLHEHGLLVHGNLTTASCSYQSVAVLNDGTKKYTGAFIYIYISLKWKSYSLVHWFHTQDHTLLQKKGIEIPHSHNWSDRISSLVMTEWNAQYCIQNVFNFTKTFLRGFICSKSLSRRISIGADKSEVVWGKHCLNS